MSSITKEQTSPIQKIGVVKSGIENDHLRLYPLLLGEVERRVAERVELLVVDLGFGFQVFLADDVFFTGFFFVAYVDFLVVDFFFTEEIDLPDALDFA